MFDQFFDLLARVLNFFFQLVPEGLRPTLGFGVAIMGLTVIVMTLITPLTIKSTRSMLQMQRMAPEMKKIQERYKDDRETLNQELMSFYKEHQINPLGGCLPLLAQMPVFIIMYQLLRGLTVRPGGLGSGAGQAIAETQLGQTVQPWIFTDQNFTPEHLNPGSALYESLSSTSDMNFLGMDLSLSAAQAVSNSILTALPYLALLLIMLGTGLYQNRQMQARNTSGSVNPQQQMIMRFMPFFLPVFSYGFPAGLALYWCTQNFCRIGTNAYITRSIYKKEQEQSAVIETTSTDSTGESDGDNPKKVKKKGATAPNSTSDKQRPSTPGKSVKSQMAHRKTSGTASTTGTSSKGRSSSKVNPRRSGEARSGPPTSKK